MARDSLRTNGIAVGETASEIASLAYANIGIQWTADGCTDFCWGISNLAGVPFFDLSNKTTSNDPTKPLDTIYAVPHYNGANTGGDGWELISTANSVASLKGILRSGDIVRVYGYNNGPTASQPETSNQIGGKYWAHEFIVYSVSGANIQVIDNWSSTGKIVLHSFDEIANTYAPYGSFGSAYVSRIDEAYIAANFSQTTLAGHGFGDFSGLGNTNHAPVVSTQNVTVANNQSINATSFFTAHDQDGDGTIAQYAIWDGGSSGGHFTVGGVTQTAGQWFYVAASNLNSVAYVGGVTAGNETLYVAANDGSQWSAVGSLTAATTQPVNHAPVVSVSDHSLHSGEWAQISNWLSYSDSDGNPATYYQLWDSGATSGGPQIWSSTSGYQTPQTTLTVSAADLTSVWLGGSHVASTETMYVRAFDGANWSNWDAFGLTTLGNTPPVAVINDHSVRTGTWTQIQNWISYSDSDGDTAKQYQFADLGYGAGSSGLWIAKGGYQAPGAVVSVAAADLKDVWVGGAANTGTDQMWVRAFDGTARSAWDSFNLIATNSAPVATINDHSLALNQWAQVSNWLTYADGDSDPATQYQFVDLGSAAGSGRFWTAAGGYHSSGPTLTVAAADLSNVWVGGATAAGTDQMWVRAYDGHAWSNWDSFTLTSHA